MHAKRYDRTGKPVVFSLWIKPQTNDFHEFVLIVLHVVAIGSFTADGGLLQPTGWCKDNTSKDPFSRCEMCKNLGYRLSWRWQDKVGLQHPEEKELCTWNCVCVVKWSWCIKPSCWMVRRPTPMTTWNQDPELHQHEAHETQQWRVTLGEHVNMRVVLVFLVLVLFLLSHSCFAHIAWLKMSECLSHLIHACSERFLWLRWSPHHLHLPSLIPHQSQAVPATLQLHRG